MPKKILIIHQNSEFMVDSITTNLRNEDTEVCAVGPVPELIAGEKKNTDLIILYAGDYIANVRSVLYGLRDFCEKDEKPLCIVGYDKDIALVEESIAPAYIAEKFVRPFEMRALKLRVQLLLTVPDTKNKKRSILLVDDDPVYLKTILKFLSEEYDVTAVRAGQHALKYLRSHTADLVLLDYDMPVMSGPQTFAEIKKDPDTCRTPVIFLTGISDRESVITVMQMKPEGYMLKNAGRDELIANLRQFFVSYKWKSIK